MPEETIRSPQDRSGGFDWSLLAFFAIAYLIAWTLVPVLDAIAAASGLTRNVLVAAIENGHWAEVAGQLTVPAWLVFTLTRIQDFAFTIAGILVALVFHGRAGLRNLGEKLRPSRASLRWYLLALALPAALYAGAAAITIANNRAIGDTLDLSAQTLLAMLISPSAGILFYLFLRAGLGEEPGLRGFALSRSQKRHGPLLVSLVIGVLWAGWHAPALVGQGMVTVIFFSFYTITLSFLFTWLFNHSNQSVWVVALLHATINAGDAAFEVILPGLEGTDWQIPALLGFVVVSIGAAVAMWRKQRQGRVGAKPIP